jgi:hypothetical protein
VQESDALPMNREKRDRVTVGSWVDLWGRVNAVNVLRSRSLSVSSRPPFAFACVSDLLMIMII